MGQIYSQCSQVFLWLGEDAVGHDQAALPSRRPLEDLEDIHTILSRNYFTRVWVIQELVLSRRISMPYVDTVYEASPQSLRHMEQTLAASPAPWLKIATQGSSHNLSWSEVMSLTSKSKSSDIRDGLYGILGLWPSGDHLPLPSYAISYQHMIIGLAAWSLTYEHNLDILYAARGVSLAELDDASPSWAPPVQNYDAWQRMVEGSALNKVQYDNMQRIEAGTNSHRITGLLASHGCPWDFQIVIDPDSGGLLLWTTKIKETQSGNWWVKEYRDSSRNHFPTSNRNDQPLCPVQASGCGLFVVTPKSLNGLVERGDELHLLAPSDSAGSHKRPSYVFFAKSRRPSIQA